MSLTPPDASWSLQSTQRWRSCLVTVLEPSTKWPFQWRFKFCRFTSFEMLRSGPRLFAVTPCQDRLTTWWLLPCTSSPTTWATSVLWSIVSLAWWVSEDCFGPCVNNRYLQPDALEITSHRVQFWVAEEVVWRSLGWFSASPFFAFFVFCFVFTLACVPLIWTAPEQPTRTK